MRHIFATALCCAFLSTGASAMDAEREAVLRRIGAFPSQASMAQRSKWCRVAVIVSYGQFDPTRKKWVMWNTTPDNLIDSCVRSNGRY
jgi:hypothetical protein